MALTVNKMTRRQLPGSNIALFAGLALLAAGASLFAMRPDLAVAALVVSWIALAYSAFGRKTLPAQLFLTLGWAALLLFVIYVYNGSQSWWIGAVIGAIALIDTFGMLRRRGA